MESQLKLSINWHASFQSAYEYLQISRPLAFAAFLGFLLSSEMIP